jgi:glycosyltransferase involved in cell wall biosynthesis
MRIAIIAPLEMRVPPLGYGGTELVVSLLTEELAQRGHDVTLFASGDSVTRAKLVSVCPSFLRGSGRDASILTMLNMVSCLERADEFDIIHNHTCFEGLATAGLVKVPVLTTLHGGLSGDWLLLFERYKGWYNTISHSAKCLLPSKDRFAGVIYNAIDCASYPFNGGGRNDYLLFLSRMSHEKGPHLAIEVAHRLEMRRILAGNVHPVDREYFQSQVPPQVDNDLIQYVGEADQTRKRELLCGARCLLASINWPEPFGLFTVEGMACGTPVVAFNRGAAPEVVRHGVTGYVVETVAEMAEAAQQVSELDPNNCRRHVAESLPPACRSATTGLIASVPYGTSRGIATDYTPEISPIEGVV